MKLIPLNRGYETMVDDIDYDAAMRYRWCMVRQGNNRQYMYASTRMPYGGNITLHRFLMKPPANLMVDHIDGNGLNNQRSNLRIVTRGQNRINSVSIALSGYKGVFKTLNGKFGIRIGAFDTAEEAARFYDEIARKCYGEFAKLNFPEES